ncbi:MAG: amidohydrolase family protein [Rudaea sp.]|uniref:amidohydrolase family protein n=1 Tax=Rudaea sp. TaxID=2136325 RepID=UPI0039E3E636
MTLVDAHQHFWRLSRGDYAWLTSGLGALYRDFEPADLASLLVQRNIDATVLVQAAATEAETRFLFDLADKHAFIKGVVGWTDFAAPAAARRIAALVEAGRGKLRGLRPMIQDLADPQWVSRRELDAAFVAMIEHDLAFDALVRPQHFPALLVRLRRHPRLRAVIDHAGKPDIAQGEYEAWARQLETLAAESNANCKLSGLLTEARTGAAMEDLAPYVEHIFHCFGGGRVIWGSDWPVLTLASGYAAWFDMARDLVARCARGHESAVFGGTATRIYRLEYQSFEGERTT